MVTVYDKENDKHFNLHKSDSRIGTVFPTSASVKLNKDMIAVYDANFNRFTMKISTISEEYIAVCKLKLKFKGKGTVCLSKYDPAIHDVKIIVISMLDRHTMETIKTLNTDKRLLNFTRYLKIKTHYNENIKS